MPIQTPPVKESASKTVPVTVAGVLLFVGVIFAINPRAVVLILILIAVGAGIWIGWQ